MCPEPEAKDPLGLLSAEHAGFCQGCSVLKGRYLQPSSACYSLHVSALEWMFAEP